MSAAPAPATVPAPDPRPLAARLLPFTLSFALFGLGMAAAVAASVAEQNLNLYRAKFAAWVSLALAGPAFGAYALGFRSPGRRVFWRWFWTFGYLAYLVHFYYAMRAFHFSAADVDAKQGGLIAMNNFVVTAWWGLDVLLAWSPAGGRRLVKIERAVITGLTFASFFAASVLFRTGFGHYLGILVTGLVAGCVGFRILDWAFGASRASDRG
jgi:hypothetical protein